ncbi:MAG: C25 family cysteine peptidase [Thermoplasmatota archaeon]
MQKIAVLFIVALFAGGGMMAGLSHDAARTASLTPSAQGDTTESYTFSFSSPEISRDGWLHVDVEGCSTVQHEGEPMLPYATHTMTFPLGTAIQDVQISLGDVETRRLDGTIAPAARPMRLDMQQAEHVQEKGPVYEREGLYPSQWLTWNTGAGLHHGEHVMFLTLQAFPARYAPQADELRHADSIDVTVTVERPAEPLLTGDEYDMLIITPQQFTDALQPLVEHKEDSGLATNMVTLDEIYASAEGRDDAEQVKYFIKNALDDWGITYVMLVGGRNGGLLQEKWWCPVRYAYADDGGETKFLSDLYFGDIYKMEDGEPVFDDWDPNGNDKFAEYTRMTKEDVDLYPDVYVGRLACRNSYEVTRMVEKIIAYETTAAGSDWFNRMVVVGGDSAPREGDPYYEGEEENKVALDYMEGFTPVRLWTSDGSLSGPQDVIGAIDDGCGFLFFDGHGNPMGWSTHPPHDEETWIDGLALGDMTKLSNEGMYPVCVVGGCHNGQFNVSLLNLLKVYEGQRWLDYVYYGEMAPESWAWWLTRTFDGGSIATMAYTGYDWFSIGDGNSDGVPDCVQRLSGYMNVHVFKQYGVDGYRMLGEMHGGAQVDYLNGLFPTSEVLDYKTVEEFVLFGDPSLMVGGY